MKDPFQHIVTTGSYQFTDPVFLAFASWPAPAIIAVVNVDEKYSEAMARLNALGDLHIDWDGYGALPISERALNQARALLSTQARNPHLGLPDIIPTPNGTLVMEWQGKQGEAAVEIGSTRVSGVIKSEQKPPLYINGTTEQLEQSLPSLIAPFLNPALMSRTPTITQIEYDTIANV